MFSKVVYWLPRILCIMAILFVSMFALDAFEPGHTLSQQLVDFLLHMIPSFILLIVLIVAWKREKLGGLIFIGLGTLLSIPVFTLNYRRTHSVGTSLFIILVITIPFVITGILFLVSHSKKKKKLPHKLNMY